MALQIRIEQPEDISGISVVNHEAFGRPNEAQLIDTLRADAALTLSLVALQNNEVVGHIAFSPMTIKNGAVDIRAIGLGPLAVKPDCQGQGIGNALVKEGLAAIRSAGWGVVIVLGSPKYYGRF